MNSPVSRSICALAAVTLLLAVLSPADEPVVRFVSAPDLINADVGYHAGRAFDMDETDPDYESKRQIILDARSRAGLPELPWQDSDYDHLNDVDGDGILSVQEGYRGGLQAIYQAIAAENPAFMTVSGDIIDGSYGLRNYDTTTVAQRRAEAEAQADIYYGAYYQHLAEAGIGKMYTVIGDHEIGDNNWDGRRLDVMPSYLGKYGQYTNMPSTVARGGYVDAPTRYQADGRVWAKQEGNVLLIGIETFDMTYDSAGNIIDVYDSTKRSNVEQEQLDWLADTLAAARTDPAIEHVITLGHLPVDDPSVRKQSSSDMRIADGADSAFWQTLTEGGADLYIAGEVHAQSGFTKQGVTQLVGGGNFFSTRETEYTVVEVYEDRIELTLKGITPIYNGDRHINGDPINEDKSKTREWRVADGDTFEVLGTMTIDTSGDQPRVVSMTGKMGNTFRDYDRATPQQALFDLGDATSALQDGFVKLAGSYDGTNVQVSFSSNASRILGEGSGLKSFWDDGEDLTALLEDGLEVKPWETSGDYSAGTNEQAYLNVRVSGLEAGEYQFVGMFHNSKTAGDGESAEVWLWPGGGTFELMGTTPYSGGENPGVVGEISFSFVTDGSGDVIFKILNDGTRGRVMLNSMELTLIPEPATLSLLAAGGVAAVLRRRGR